MTQVQWYSCDLDSKDLLYRKLPLKIKIKTILLFKYYSINIHIYIYIYRNVSCEYTLERIHQQYRARG